MFPRVKWRGKWDCPACATKKLAEITEHLVTQAQTLCWGSWSLAKAKNASRRRIGYMKIAYTDDEPVMIAASHIYTPSKPSLTVIQEVLAHTMERTVSRIGWSDNWRPDKQTHPEDWLVLPTDISNLATVNAAIERAGVIDGKLAGRDPHEVKSVIEQILNGASFDKG